MQRHFIVFLQAQSVSEIMPNKGNKKAKIADDESEVEITSRVEIIYGDTKSVTGTEPEYKWGTICHMLQDKKVPDTSLEDLNLHDNILRSRITKVSTIPELFPCSEVIGWIISKVDAKGMIMYNVEDK